MSENSIQWLKFAERLRAEYEYLLNPDLYLLIAKQAREFVKTEGQK